MQLVAVINRSPEDLLTNREVSKFENSHAKQEGPPGNDYINLNIPEACELWKLKGVGKRGLERSSDPHFPIKFDGNGTEAISLI